jgi:hypothetical protein
LDLRNCDSRRLRARRPTARFSPRRRGDSLDKWPQWPDSLINLSSERRRSTGRSFTSH